MAYILKEWSLAQDNSDPYKAPELRRSSLGGKVYGHPNFPDGAYVYTSTPVRAEGRRVFTRSGSEYVLEGPPDELFVKYLAENKFQPLDLEHPFKNLED